MKLYSFNLLGPREVDAITGDKIYPPIYRTVQNKQPIPEGTVQKRNSISSETILTGSSHKETQLISYVYLKGGPDTTAVAAISDRSAATRLYKWDGAEETWGQFSPDLTNDTEDGIYYVCNALDFSGEPSGGDAVTTDLFVVKYNSTPSGSTTPGAIGSPCCYSIATDEADDTYRVTKFDGSQIVLGDGVVWTGNWKTARCAEYHPVSYTHLTLPTILRV